MSDNIPFEIQVEIIKRLPIKSLVQFRSVSKAWKSVIESSDFIADYTFHNPAQPQHLLIRYYNLYSEEIYVSIVDDDMFPQNKVSLTVPRSVNLLWDSFVVGTSSGLICLFGYYRYEGDSGFASGEATAVLWNPSIKKSVAIAVPDVGRHAEATFGFGVCPATSDPKIVKINDRAMDKKIPWEVEVFSLSSGVWRSSFGNLSDNLVDFKWPCSQITVGGFFYWFGVGDDVGSDTGLCFIISFDLSSEKFREIYLPNELALHDAMGLYLFNLCDCLVVLRGWIMDDIIEVWMMEDGDSKLFSKFFTINKPYSSSSPLIFRRNCELMMRVTNDPETEYSEALIDYDPFSEQINDLGIESQCYTLLVSSYTESIILLDQKDTLLDDEDDEEMSV